MVKLTTELIYDAALDDELFAELPAIIADSIDARSCVLHWRTNSGAAEIFAHSGYFTDEQMANYAINFVAHDLWTEAGQKQGFVNQAWNIADLVPPSQYERSIFYNEWIRATGDDTYWCCGSVTQTIHGQGIIGLHRGRKQPNFTPAALQKLNGHVDHLRRMFAIRGRIAHIADRHELLSAIFSAGREAALVLGADGRLLMANPAAEEFLRAGRLLSLRQGIVGPANAEANSAFEAALGAASAVAGRKAAECIISDASGSVALHMMPLPSITGSRGVLVTVTKPRSRPASELVQRQLIQLYGLSLAEAEVALRLAEGHTIADISDHRGSAVGTVRIQVKQILSKMGARRQADVVRAILNLW